MIQGIGLVGAGDLKSLMELLKGADPIKEYERLEDQEKDPGQEKYAGDFSEVNGQKVLRRAAEVAVAGMHNLLMIGPAGSGKTMVARRLPTILPAMTQEERIEISKIYSVCNLLSGEEPLIRRRPFDRPGGIWKDHGGPEASDDPSGNDPGGTDRNFKNIQCLQPS